jgi:hypothetical protein
MLVIPVAGHDSMLRNLSGALRRIVDWLKGRHTLLAFMATQGCAYPADEQLCSSAGGC